VAAFEVLIPFHRQHSTYSTWKYGYSTRQSEHSLSVGKKQNRLLTTLEHHRADLRVERIFVQLHRTRQSRRYSTAHKTSVISQQHARQTLDDKWQSILPADFID